MRIFNMSNMCCDIFLLVDALRMGKIVFSTSAEKLIHFFYQYDNMNAMELFHKLQHDQCYNILSMSTHNMSSMCRDLFLIRDMFRIGNVIFPTSAEKIIQNVFFHGASMNSNIINYASKQTCFLASWVLWFDVYLIERVMWLKILLCPLGLRIFAKMSCFHINLVSAKLGYFTESSIINVTMSTRVITAFQVYFTNHMLI